jgi:hypothetical protein
VTRAGSPNSPPPAIQADVPPPLRGRDSFFVLFKGGRLPSWYLLDEAERTAAEQNHIDLMLSVAKRHGMRRLEGFRLMGQQHDWQRFWVIEFPTLDGSAPSSGRRCGSPARGVSAGRGNVGHVARFSTAQDRARWYS